MALTPRRPDPAQLSLFVAPQPTASADRRTEVVATESLAPVVEPVALAPAEFRHPLAAREIVLGGHTVAYALKRVRRRSIGFIVGTDGLSVNAPSWVVVRDIESALREKAAWILGKLHQQRDRGRRLQSARVDWRDGVTIPFLGQTVVVALDSRAGVTPSGAVLDAVSGDASSSGGAVLRQLHIGLPPGAAPEQIRDAVQSWLQRQAKRVFAERCDVYAAQLGVRYRRLSLSSAQTRWGSASADGAIRLSWRLIHFGLPTIDYVVAHELAHLREMNHSERFWDVVRSVVPDYERTRRALKTDVLPVFG
ncbi:MAG: SprT family zinc-dependent metalloprotease [Pseudomonadota bacterium]|nr:SprT family zinc-dependent metalloprotease [Pseudomonadota bacterium]